MAVLLAKSRADDLVIAICPSPFIKKIALIEKKKKNTQTMCRQMMCLFG